MFAEIDLESGETFVLAIVIFTLIFLSGIIFAFRSRIGKSKENIPQWLNISEDDFREKVKIIVQEELKKESDFMKAKDL
jgi:cbb3-type cytochrome oxidase subunit 3